jgi:hypothetical protein
MNWAGNVARMGEQKNVCRILVGKPEVYGLIGRFRLRWEDNIEMDLRDIGYGD